MRIEDAVNIDDLRRLARRRLPRIVFDFIEGGVEDEHCLVANETSFARHRMVPRYLVEVDRRDQSADAVRPQATRARSASRRPALRRCSVPMPISCWPGPPRPPTSRSSCRALPPPRSRRPRRWRPTHTWYQLYAARDQKISEDHDPARARCRPGHPGADRRRAGARQARAQPAQRLRAAVELEMVESLEALMHPRWIASYLRHGMPRFDNWAPYASPARAPRRSPRSSRGRFRAA